MQAKVLFIWDDHYQTMTGTIDELKKFVQGIKDSKILVNKPLSYLFEYTINRNNEKETTQQTGDCLQ